MGDLSKLGCIALAHSLVERDSTLRRVLKDCSLILLCPAKAASQRKTSVETFHLALTWAGEKAGGLQLMVSLLNDGLGVGAPGLEGDGR